MKRLWVWLIWLSIALLVVALGVWRLRPHDEPLLKRAHMVAGVSALPQFSGPKYHVPWLWLSDQAILLLRSANGTLAASANTVRNVETVNATRVQIPGGQSAPVPQLDATLRPYVSAVTRQARVSPDGRQLLFDVEPRTARHPAKDRRYVQVPIDGGSPCIWDVPADNPYPTPYAWRGDSRSWVRLVPNDIGIGFRVMEARSAARPAEVEPISLPSNDAVGRAMGILSDGRFLVGDWNVKDEFRRVHLIAFDAPKGRRGTKTFLLSPPRGTHVRWVAMTPHEDRLAWLVDRRAVSPALDQLEVWVSRVDGSGMRLRGRTPLPLGALNDDPDDRCAWSPTARQLAFTLHDQLWVIPMD